MTNLLDSIVWKIKFFYYTGFFCNYKIRLIDKNKVLKLFDKTLSINGIGEQKDLLLIKKALFLSKNKIDKKSLEILGKIKNSKSLWKDLAENNYNVLSKN